MKFTNSPFAILDKNMNALDYQKRNLVYEDPIKRNAGLDIYENPIKEHNYIMTVDVARGLGNDYSAFIVFDTTEFPYKAIAKYRNNEIKPMEYSFFLGRGKNQGMFYRIRLNCYQYHL